MTAPVADKVILPLDTGNTGKKMRTQSRVIGADTVHEHFFVPSDSTNLLGMYCYHGGTNTILAAAQNGTTTGFWWLFNPIGSTIKIALEMVKQISSFVTSLSTPTSPRVLLSLFTYTGTPSGAVVTAAKHNSTFPTAQSSFRTASTGMTVTLGATLQATRVPISAGTAAWMYLAPFVDTFYAMSEDDRYTLRAGEGIVCWQADAATTSDTRVIHSDCHVEEFE